MTYKTLIGLYLTVCKLSDLLCSLMYSSTKSSCFRLSHIPAILRTEWECPKWRYIASTNSCKVCSPGAFNQELYQPRAIPSKSYLLHVPNVLGEFGIGVSCLQPFHSKARNCCLLLLQRWAIKNCIKLKFRNSAFEELVYWPILRTDI